MEFMFGLLAGLLWWEFFLLIIVCGVTAISMFTENGFLFLITIAAILFYPWVEAGSLFGQLSLAGLLVFFLAYIAIGVAWSFFQWNRKTAGIAKDTAKYYEGKNQEELTNEVRDLIEREKKMDRFIYWIANWPLSGIRYFCGEMIRDFFKKVVEIFSGFYSKVGDKNIKKYAVTKTPQQEKVAD